MFVDLEDNVLTGTIAEDLSALPTGAVALLKAMLKPLINTSKSKSSRDATNFLIVSPLPDYHFVVAFRRNRRVPAR